MYGAQNQFPVITQAERILLLRLCICPLEPALRRTRQAPEHCFRLQELARRRQVAQTRHVEVVEIETSLLTESASAMFVSTPVPQAVEELVEASKAFSQNRVQQSSMKQIIANPAISLAEKTFGMPVTRTKKRHNML